MYVCLCVVFTVHVYVKNPSLTRIYVLYTQEIKLYQNKIIINFVYIFLRQGKPKKKEYYFPLANCLHE